MTATLNARDCGATPGFRHDKTSRVALQRAVDEMRGAGGRTINVPTGVCEFAGATGEISTAASVTGTVRIRSEESATVVQSVGSNLFVLTGAQNSRSSGGVLLEGIGFPRGIPTGGLRDVPHQMRSCQKA
jgi:hypothetical protein